MRAFGPLTAENPSLGPCAACQEPFVEGDYLTLVPLGPGSDPDARERARAGRPYNAVAACVHLACATGAEAPGAEGSSS